MTMKNMITNGLRKLKTATIEEICDWVEKDHTHKFHVPWVQHGRKRPWRRTLKKRLLECPKTFIEAGKNDKGEALYTLAEKQAKNVKLKA